MSDAPQRSRRRWAVAGAGAAVAAVAVGAWAVYGTGERSHVRVDAEDGLRHTAVSVSAKGCGAGWVQPRAGLQVFDVRNRAGSAYEVYLQDARTGAVHGELDGLGPEAARALRADLGNGSYRFVCFPDDASPVHGRTVRITGSHHRGGPAVRPLSVHDLIPPTLRYQKWIKGQMDPLVKRTEDLRRAVDAGDTAGAKKAWLAAHRQYERMGAAYGTFGDSDAKINGTTAGLPKGVHDPGFTGFHRIEYGLWHGQSSQLKGPVQQLAGDVRELRSQWADARMDPLDLGLRAHEILENTVQFELTARTDYGSGSNLATARANLDGTRTALNYLRPLLASRMPRRLPRIEHALTALTSAYDRYQHGDSWTPPEKLSRPDRQRLNAQTGALVEQLADVAAICDVRRTGE